MMIYVMYNSDDVITTKGRIILKLGVFVLRIIFEEIRARIVYNSNWIFSYISNFHNPIERSPVICIMDPALAFVIFLLLIFQSSEIYK